MTSALVIILAVASVIGQTGRICAVAVQDRSKASVSTSGLDDLVTSAIARSGFDVVNLEFDPPADVEYAARTKGCSHILYTDIVLAKESAASPACRLFKRMIAAHDTATMNSEVEFRLFRLDEVLPLVSTTVSGKATARRLSPYVSSRVVELQQPPSKTSMAPASLRTAAFEEAFKRQARIIHGCVISGACTRPASPPSL